MPPYLKKEDVTDYMLQNICPLSKKLFFKRTDSKRQLQVHIFLTDNHTPERPTTPYTDLAYPGTV